VIVKYVITQEDAVIVGLVGWHLVYSLVRVSKGRTTCNIQSWLEW